MLNYFNRALAVVSIFGFCASLSSCKQADHKTEQAAASNPAAKDWWKKAVVYQIYPRSFKDSNGDGVGDLNGITSKLDYIKSLGVNTVWLNPVYSSPNTDNGYDVSDYRAIMKEFGTMDDFDKMLKGMHQRGIKLVMDLVVNHSSNQHEWFKQSRSSRSNPYRNYYHWWNAERGKPPYRYSLFDVNHDAWHYDSLTNAYYLHYFSVQQPDLNWENPKVRHEVYDVMKFWVDKGIDGFRMDAFQFAAKDTTFPKFPVTSQNFMKYYAIGPHLHDYLQEMNKEVYSKYNLMSVAEGAGNSLQDAHDMVDADRHELDMAYAFDGVGVAGLNGYSVLNFKKVFSRWDSAFAKKGWLSIFLANHDQARMVSRFGNDSPQFREVSSKMLNTFLLTMRGTPYIYNGDELGMTNAGFTKITDYNDVALLNEYQHMKIAGGGDLNKFLLAAGKENRDNGRTPFPWKDSVNAGFTTGKPWLKINPNYTTINAAAEEQSLNSCLNYFKKAVKLRAANPALVFGKYTLLDKNNPDVYAYTREMDGRKILIVLNFKAVAAEVKTGLDLSKAKVLLRNYPAPSANGKLKPYEAVVYQL